MESRIYARKFLRIRPNTQVFGMARIIYVGERHVLSNIARVRILDISPGGIRFSSMLELPVDNKIILELSMILGGNEYCLEGYIVNQRSTGIREYEYGYRFIKPDPGMRLTLMRVFCRLSERRDRKGYMLSFDQGIKN